MDDAISPEQHESPVKWFELFYDLVIVAAVVTFSDAISARKTFANLAWVTFAFVVIWLVWFATTFRFNHDRRDGPLDRLIIVAQMAALSTCAIAIGEGPGEERTAVALSFGVVVLTLAVMTWRSGLLQFDCTKFFRVRSAVLLFASVCIFASAVAPESWYGALWAVAALSYLTFWVVHHVRPNWQVPPIDVHHMAERLGLLTIIVLGEAFVKLAIVASSDDVSSLDIEVGVVMFICVFAVFWAYFDDVPKAGIVPGGVGRLALFSGHLVMQIGCVGLAIGFAYLARDSVVSSGWRAGAFAVASAAVVYFGLALLGAGTERRPVAPLTVLRLATGLVLVAVAACIPLLNGWNANVLAYALAVVMLVHGALSQWLVSRTRVGSGDAAPVSV